MVSTRTGDRAFTVYPREETFSTHCNSTIVRERLFKVIVRKAFAGRGTFSAAFRHNHFGVYGLTPVDLSKRLA